MKEKIRQIFNYIADYFKDENIPYENKSFYLVLTCTIPVYWVIALIFTIAGSDRIMMLLSLTLSVYSALIICAGSLVRKQPLFSLFYAITLNFLIIPIMFFMSEGVYYGMIMFFVLGMILTVFQLGNYKNIYYLVGIEFIYDIVLITYAFLHKEKVYLDKSKMSPGSGIAISFFLVALTIIILFLYQNFINTQMSKKVENDNESIRKADNTKGRFLANMTHEIRTPMNAIIGMTNLMLKENLSVSSRENSNIIKTESAQLLQIINNILEFSKLDSGRAELINNVFSFRELIVGIIQDTLNVYTEDDIKLFVFISKDIPDKLFGDEVRIRQVLKYLLFSRLSRTPGGTVNLHIDSSFDESTRSVTFKFRIASTGNGLNESEITAIYNAYSNYDSRQKTDYNRSGLEISICKKILNMMGGDIEIESIEGIGNAFEFSFTNYVVENKPIIELDKNIYVRPLMFIYEKNIEQVFQKIVEEVGVSASYVRTPLSFRRALETQTFTQIYIPQKAYKELYEYIEMFDCADQVYVVTDQMHSIGDFGKCRILRMPFYLFNFIESINGSYNKDDYASPYEKISITYPYARVLCVDDSNVNLMVMDNILREYGIKATLCNSGKKAIEALDVSEFDLVFIDQKMPEMDGIELAYKIRHMMNPNASIPLICATADFGPGIREQLIQKGFSDYISKPIGATYLEKVLDKYLPADLKVEKKNQNKKKVVETISQNSNETSLDPTLFDTELGMHNLGDNEETYISVLRAFYEEGNQKLIDVPKQFADNNIADYTTNVHALKSSSATVGFPHLSALFKKLEAAGKEGNTEYISENSDQAFAYFQTALTKIKDYLDTNDGSYTVEDDKAIETAETVELDKELLSELSECISAMNLRRVEEIIHEISERNYGKDINSMIKKIRNSYENFEYIEIKALIKELL